MEPLPIHVSGQDLLHLFHQSGGSSVLVDLEVDGQVHLAIPREIQRDHIHGRYVHIDFLAVRRDEKVKLTVEVHEVGEAPGVRAGGVIEHHLREIEVECLPSDVPEGIEADVSSLEIGDMLRVGDIAPPSGVTFLSDPDMPVISVITPAALRTEADLTLPGEEAAPEEVAEEAPEAPAPEAPGEEAGGEG
jgi:large subunit ribosomal protein L25